MDAIERIIDLSLRNGIDIGCVQTMSLLGVTSGELSESKAVKTYGKWFIEAIQRDELKPCRVGNGKTGTRWYKVTDILSYKARKEIRAALR